MIRHFSCLLTISLGLSLTGCQDNATPDQFSISAETVFQQDDAQMHVISVTFTGPCAVQVVDYNGGQSIRYFKDVRPGEVKTTTISLFAAQFGVQQPEGLIRYCKYYVMQEGNGGSSTHQLLPNQSLAKDVYLTAGEAHAAVGGSVSFASILGKRVEVRVVPVDQVQEVVDFRATSETVCTLPRDSARQKAEGECEHKRAICSNEHEMSDENAPSHTQLDHPAQSGT